MTLPGGRADPGMTERRVGALGAHQPEFEGTDTDVMKALSHELRQRVLVACTERTASPSDLADEWGESRSLLAYHVRVLHKLGALELVREERVHGSVKHYYRTVLRPIFSDGEWARVPLALRRRVEERLLTRLLRDVAEAASCGGFDEPATHISRAILALDDEAFAELSELLADVLHRALELDAESDERRARGESKTSVPTELAILHFLREPPERSP